jgi:hypothetical protein
MVENKPYCVGRTIATAALEKLLHNTQRTLFPGQPMRYAGSCLLEMIHVCYIPFVVSQQCILVGVFGSKAQYALRFFYGYK